MLAGALRAGSCCWSRYMALVSMSVGNGRAAYATPWGQTMVVVGIASVVACWVWADRLLRLPAEQRVSFE